MTTFYWASPATKLQWGSQWKIRPRCVLPSGLFSPHFNNSLLNTYYVPGTVPRSPMEKSKKNIWDMGPVLPEVYNFLGRYSLVQSKTRLLTATTEAWTEHWGRGKPGFQKDTLIQVVEASCSFLNIPWCAKDTGRSSGTNWNKQGTVSVYSCLCNKYFLSICYVLGTNRTLWNCRWLSILFTFKEHLALFLYLE